MFTKAAFYWVMLLCPIISYSQDKGYFDFNEPVPPTPNTASLGKYGDIPVSLHTGVPNISIPIYSFSEGALSMNISLSYHSSGIRVDEVASWVGLGWSLNAGGMITRTVMGGPDEGKKGVQKGLTNLSGHGWYKDHGIPKEIIDCKQQPSNPVSDSSCPSCNCAWYNYDAANGFIDTEPDLYSYSVNGISGKFYFDEDGNVVSHPINDVKIIPDFESNEFSTWRIVAPDGTQYVFGEDNSIEKSYSNYSGTPGFQEDYHTTTSWYITKIISADTQDIIYFEYETEEYGFSNRVTQSVSVNAGTCQLSGDVNEAPTYLMGNSVDGKRLSRITTKSGFHTIDFIVDDQPRDDLHSPSSQLTRNTSAKGLNEIKITNGRFCKSFKLNKEYYLSDEASGYPNNLGVYTDGSDLSRLKLLSIQESSCNSEIEIPPYVFEYNTQSLPRRYSLARDHWGYYNGATQNKSLIPNVSYTCLGEKSFTTGSNREPNENFMKAGILEAVIYPTGGKTVFSYQGHKVDGDNKLIGGLRISKQESFDENGKLALTKEYQYLGGRLYSGVIDYVNDPSSSPLAGVYGVRFNLSISSSPKPALQSTQGYHVGYGEVRIKYFHGGYESHRFNNVTPSINFQFPSPPAVQPIGAASLDILSYYDSEGSKVYLKDDSYNYDDQKSISAIRISSLCPTDVPNCGNTPFIFYTDYSLRTSRFRIQSSSEERDGVRRLTQYNYNPQTHQNSPIEISFVNSLGTQVKQLMKYPLDIQSEVPSQMILKNMIGLPVEMTEYYGNRITKKTINRYVASNGMILLAETKVQPTGDPNGEIKLSLEYDSEGNAIKQQEGVDYPISYLWDQTGTKVLAKVINSEPNEIYYESFNANDTTIEPYSGLGCHSSGVYTIPSSKVPIGNHLVMTYWYFQNGEWQFQEEIDFTPTINRSGAQALDEIRVYPRFSQMVTYSYDQGGVLIDQCDENGRVSYYEYDDLSRINAVKDHNKDLVQTTSYHYYKSN